MMPTDVTAAQLNRQAELWRRLGPQKQLEVAASMWTGGRRAAELSIRSRNPGASEELVRWLMAEMFLGNPVATRLYGPQPK